MGFGHRAEFLFLFALFLFSRHGNRPGQHGRTSRFFILIRVGWKLVTEQARDKCEGVFQTVAQVANGRSSDETDQNDEQRIFDQILAGILSNQPTERRAERARGVVAKAYGSLFHPGKGYRAGRGGGKGNQKGNGASAIISLAASWFWARTVRGNAIV